MTKEPEKVQLTVITQEIEDIDDPPAALAGDREGSASSSAGGTGGESSEGEGDIEIEHVGDESGVSSGGAGGSVHGLLPSGNITFDVRRRTLINIYQRTILEEFYRCGMTSASLMLNHLHTAAAEKTGLDISVVKVHACTVDAMRWASLGRFCVFVVCFHFLARCAHSIENLAVSWYQSIGVQPVGGDSPETYPHKTNVGYYIE